MYVIFQLVLILYPHLFLVKVQLCTFLLGKYSMFLMSSSFSWSRAVFFRVFLVKSQVVQFRSKSQKFLILGRYQPLRRSVANAVIEEAWKSWDKAFNQQR